MRKLRPWTRTEVSWLSPGLFLLRHAARCLFLELSNITYRVSFFFFFKTNAQSGLLLSSGGVIILNFHFSFFTHTYFNPQYSLVTHEFILLLLLLGIWPLFLRVKFLVICFLIHNHGSLTRHYSNSRLKFLQGWLRES